MAFLRSLIPLNTSTTVSYRDVATPITVSPILPSLNPYFIRPVTTVTSMPIVPTSSTVFRPPGSSIYYMDSGLGSNPFVQNQINTELRDKFLEKWLYVDYPDILRMLRVENGDVKVLSKEQAESNDISKDSEIDLTRKSKYIGHNILTTRKNLKILQAFLEKNYLKWYDLPHNEKYVRREQAKYVKHKLEKNR